MNNDSSFWGNKKILVTGATGFVGKNLVNLLKLLSDKIYTPTRHEYDLVEQVQVRKMFNDIKPDIVIHLAGLVGGILINKKKPAEFCYQNLMMGSNVIHESYRSGVKKFVTLIGGCSYPAKALSPISEDELWNGYPQEESAPYAMAKAMSVILSQSYRRQFDFNSIVLVPGNLYGPYDNFDMESSHVIPALIRKFIEAKKKGLQEVLAWGSGRSIRDFVFVEDVCQAIILATETYNNPEIINISSGIETTIRELVETISNIVGYEGQIIWDTSKPEGQLKKSFDVTRMKKIFGELTPTSLAEGLKKSITWFDKNYTQARLDK